MEEEKTQLNTQGGGDAWRYLQKVQNLNGGGAENWWLFKRNKQVKEQVSRSGKLFARSIQFPVQMQVGGSFLFVVIILSVATV